MTPDAIKIESEKMFRPAWWLPDGHSQTLWRKFSAAPAAHHQRQRIELADGDFIDLDWSAKVDSRDSETLVLIVHGLCGCSESSYVLALQSQLNRAGIPSVVMNLRSCSGEVNRKARTYHSGVSDDLEEVLTELRRLHPTKKIVGVGYSLGANVLLKYLGEAGSKAIADGAIAVSTPFTLSHCSKAMLGGLSRIYGRYFTRRLRMDLARKIEHFRKQGNAAELGKLLALGDLDSIASVWEFDELVTAPVHGFANADDYYKKCSSINFLDAIETDTLLIQSSNDPMIPPSALPQHRQLPAKVHMELLNKGGHVGFINAGNQPWLEQRLLDFVQSH